MGFGLLTTLWMPTRLLDDSCSRAWWVAESRIWLQQTPGSGRRGGGSRRLEAAGQWTWHAVRTQHSVVVASKRGSGAGRGRGRWARRAPHPRGTSPPSSSLPPLIGTASDVPVQWEGDAEETRKPSVCYGHRHCARSGSGKGKRRRQRKHQRLVSSGKGGTHGRHGFVIS
jgi:hypothetical protein